MMAGIYPQVRIEDYVRDCFHVGPPSLSASIANVLLTTSPSHAWHAHPRLNPKWAQKSTEATDLGSIAHALLLEGDRSKVVVVNADDWRTKSAKEAREAARSDGKLPVLANKMAAVEEMVAVAMGALGRSELGTTAFLREDVEQTLLWEEDGVLLRTRPDWLSPTRKIILDYKSVKRTAEPNVWARGPMLALGHYLQTVLGLHAMAAIGITRCAFVFMVQEITAPYAVSFVGLSPAFLDFAEHRLIDAKNQWKHCLDTDTWPSYPPRICWAEPPAWVVNQAEEKQALAANLAWLEAKEHADDGVDAL